MFRSPWRKSSDFLWFPVARHAQCFVPYTNQSLFVDLRVRKAPMKQNRVQRSGTREEEHRAMARSDHLSLQLGSREPIEKGRNSRCFQAPTSSSSSSFYSFFLAVPTTVPQLLTQIKTFPLRHRFLPNTVTFLSYLPPFIVRRLLFLLRNQFAINCTEDETAWSLFYFREYIFPIFSHKRDFILEEKVLRRTMIYLSGESGWTSVVNFQRWLSHSFDTFAVIVDRVTHWLPQWKLTYMVRRTYNIDYWEYR